MAVTTPTPYNVCCEDPAVVTTGKGILVVDPITKCEVLLTGEFPGLVIDKNGDVQIYNGSDTSPIVLPNLREKQYLTFATILIKEVDGTITALLAPNDGVKYNLTAKNGEFFFTPTTVSSETLGEFVEYILPVPDSAKAVSFNTQFVALEAVNPSATIKVLSHFTVFDSATESSLGDAGLDLTLNTANYVGLKPAGQSHKLHIRLGVFI